MIILKVIMEILTQEQKNSLLNSIRDIPDFPKPGIIFQRYYHFVEQQRGV